MLNIVLYQPEIPPNTGNIIRLCANTGAQLHLVGPLGFALDEKRVRRAGLDYHEFSQVKEWTDWNEFTQAHVVSRLWAFTTRASRTYSDARFESGDGLLFGPETRGLPQNILNELGTDNCLRLPMAANSRSLDLSNTVAIALYEGLRQQGFPGLD